MCKRVFFPIFLGLLVLTLMACGGGGDDSGGDSDADSATTDAQATLVPQSPSSAQATETPTATPVATEGELFLQMISPPESEVFTETGNLAVVGRTRVDAVVTINDTIVEPDIDGEFSLDVALEEGPNIIEIVASVASGEQLDQVLVAIYLP